MHQTDRRQFLSLRHLPQLPIWSQHTVNKALMMQENIPACSKYVSFSSPPQILLSLQCREPLQEAERKETYRHARGTHAHTHGCYTHLRITHTQTHTNVHTFSGADIFLPHLLKKYIFMRARKMSWKCLSLGIIGIRS